MEAKRTPPASHGGDPPPDGPHPAPPPFSAVVHVIDDDAITLWVFKELLQGIGAEIRAFGSAREFLAEYRPTPCECLVSRTPWRPSRKARSIFSKNRSTARC
ncbi:MAG: hypothetical protein LBI87_04735 [Candidatus Accumulibacter sp.]|jgi:hypothetical protein|nr:hypothetical protein [Accumulibacter sp.]